MLLCLSLDAKLPCVDVGNGPAKAVVCIAAIILATATPKHTVHYTRVAAGCWASVGKQARNFSRGWAKIAIYG